MYKLLLLFFCVFLLLLEAQPAQAAASEGASIEAESLLRPRVPRPNYKRYRGNSRSKHRHLGLFRRWRARRKAQRKAKAPKGVIKVDAPTGTMPPRP
ncbi:MULTISPECIES: hypothetical protein [Hymenobacter]|uniref:Uncharacterized protein n=1 Tax=Hymenobacter jejuensis TaxID=2502781 RepID=A0A5B8A0B0_9BACT|nr:MULTISPECIES: hypothetical protein [Hymenobacter]MBC6991915.1 hypothetical protein [Hymenobacter sp. BT491]QDA60236.1 hypothetical protein FHG12_08980 [Hymenobacter jejuensis]